MGINLQKGQRIDLTKGNAGLSKIMVGLGWDPIKHGLGGKGLLGGLFGGGREAEIDCDASVMMLNENDKLSRKQDIIYFGNLKSKDGSLTHMGDNLTGEGAGDDEQIMIELSRISANIHKLVFVVNIYDCVKRKQDFGMIENAFIRIVNLADNKELLRFNLTEQYGGKTGLIVGEVYRRGNEWKFAAIGEGTNDTSISKMAQNYM